MDPYDRFTDDPDVGTTLIEAGNLFGDSAGTSVAGGTRDLHW